jgi:hypothetical protein
MTVARLTVELHGYRTACTMDMYRLIDWLREERRCEDMETSAAVHMRENRHDLSQADDNRACVPLIGQLQACSVCSRLASNARVSGVENKVVRAHGHAHVHRHGQGNRRNFIQGMQEALRVYIWVSLHGVTRVRLQSTDQRGRMSRREERHQRVHDCMGNEDDGMHSRSHARSRLR